MKNRDILVDGQELTQFTQEEVLNMVNSPDFLDKENLEGINLDRFRFYLKLKPGISRVIFPNHVLFSIGKSHPIKLNDMVFVLVNVKGIQVRSEFEGIICRNCSKRIYHAYHGYSPLYSGLENEWEILRRNDSLAFDLKCPSCSHPTGRRSVWVFTRPDQESQKKPVASQ